MTRVIPMAPERARRRLEVEGELQREGRDDGVATRVSRQQRSR